MSLLPNVPFNEGSVWWPSLADLAFQAPIFDDQPEYLGHRMRLTDAELSDQAGQIKSRVSEAFDALRVSVFSGLVCTIAAGGLIKQDGTAIAVPSQNITVADNAVSFIWASIEGTIQAGAQPPAIRLLLARVTAASGAISVLEDLRALAQRSIAPVASSVRVFGGSNVTDYTAAQGDQLNEGTYYFRNFTVPSGVVVTVDKYARIVCSGVVTIDGRVVVSTLPVGAPGFPTSLTDQESGGARGAGIGGGGTSYPPTLQPYGSGGSSGFGNGNGSGKGRIGGGGDGGGCFIVEASGTVAIAGRIEAPGANAQAPTELTTLGTVSGSGGGSGGFVSLSSLRSVTVAPGAVIDLKGGNGSNAAITGWSQHGGGGGGGAGGVLLVSAPTYNLTGATIDLAGGTKGNDSGTPVNTGGGIGGGFGGSCVHGQPGTAGRTILRSFLPNG